MNRVVGPLWIFTAYTPLLFLLCVDKGLEAWRGGGVLRTAAFASDVYLLCS